MLTLGRAGRYGSKYPVGEVTCIHADDLPLLHSSINAPSPTLEVIVLSVGSMHLRLVVVKCNSC